MQLRFGFIYIVTKTQLTIFSKLFILWKIFKIMANLGFKIYKIQAGLGLSNYCFMQLQRDIWQEVKSQGLTIIMLATNDIKYNI